MKKILLWMILGVSVFALETIGTVMALRGEVNVVREGASESLAIGAAIYEKDRIQTAKRSRVQVMLKDDTVVTIGSNSDFSFEEFLFDATKNSKVKMRANKGFFRSVTGKLSKVAPERFKVKTPSATIGIRGTDFSGEITQDAERISCYSGAIRVDFNGQALNVDAGSLVEIRQKTYKIKKIPTVSVKKKEETKKENAKNDKNAQDKEDAEEETQESQGEETGTIDSVIEAMEEQTLIPQPQIDNLEDITIILENEEEPVSDDGGDGLDVTSSSQERNFEY